jgi:NitT/TauT family transport system substrate-binding protein
MKRLKIAGIAVAALLLATGCSSQAPANPTSTAPAELQVVHVGQVVLPIFAPLYVADAKGYFKDEGIKLDLQSVQSGSVAVPLAANGQLDVVVAGFSAGLFSAISTGLDIKVVGSMGVSDGTTKSPTDLVSSKGITSIAALKGKKIGAAGGVGATGAYLLSLALQTAGLTVKDVTVVNLGNPDMPAALANGSIDAGLMSAPFSTNATAAGGVSLWVPAKGVSSTGVIYGGKFAKSPLAQKFFNALAKGAKDLQNGKGYDQQNLDIIGAATGQTAAKVKSIPLYTWLPNLAPLPDQLTGMEKFWLDNGALTYSSPMATSTYIDGSFAKKVK